MTDPVLQEAAAVPRAQRHFLRVVISDIYALLDFLSSRASPALSDPPYAGSRSRNPDAEIGSKEPDPDGQSSLRRAMLIGKQLEAGDGDIRDGDAAFLIWYRDKLNIDAVPATGSSISFTMRVIERLFGACRVRGADGYLVPDPQLDHAAQTLSDFVESRLTRLLRLLFVTVALSTYIAFGKLLLDTGDAVNRDFGINLTALVAESGLATYNTKELSNWAKADPNHPNLFLDPLIDEFCQAHELNMLMGQSCHQRESLKERKQNIHDLLAIWVWPLHWLNSIYTKDPNESAGHWAGEKAEQLAGTMIGTFGNYLLPVFYGWLGAMASVLRRLNAQLADFLLTPRDVRASRIRIILGTVTGACIGLFVNSSTGAATQNGIGGAAVTLSASGIAFLAGYAVEAVFKMLDRLMNNVFKIGQKPKDA